MNKLLLTMCTDIDGVLTYIVSILIELMSFHCKNESVENLANYRALSELVDSKFFKDEDKEAQFEASLLILGSLVPKIKLRLDLINLFMSFLKNTIQIMAGGADEVKDESKHMKIHGHCHVCKNLHRPNKPCTAVVCRGCWGDKCAKAVAAEPYSQSRRKTRSQDS